MNNKIFDSVLEQNAKYVNMIENNASAELQEAQLEVCSELFENLILKTGLISEYAEYCKKINFKNNSKKY